MGNIFSRRQLQWNMGYLYPGLMLRVAPSVSPGGQLEFVLDAHREALNVQSLKEASTGKFELVLLLAGRCQIQTNIKGYLNAIH